LAEINKRLNEPYYFDLLFTFFMMLAKAIDDDGPNLPELEDQEIVEESDENSSGEEKKVKQTKVLSEPIRNIVNIINSFMVKSVPKYRIDYQLEQITLFSNPNIARLIEHFFNWLTNKKYLCHRIRINDNFNFDEL
jgi:hypothetical protein